MTKLEKTICMAIQYATKNRKIMYITKSKGDYYIKNDICETDNLIRLAFPDELDAVNCKHKFDCPMMVK